MSVSGIRILVCPSGRLIETKTKEEEIMSLKNAANKQGETKVF